MADVFEIPTSPTPQTFAIALGGVTYRLSLRWNAVSGLWYLDIADIYGNAMLRGIPLVTGADLLEPYGYMGFTGKLFAATDNNPTSPPAFANLGTSAHLYWVNNG